MLGTGGLVRAYSETTLKALEKTEYIEKIIGYKVKFCIEYDALQEFKYYANKNNLKIINIEYLENIEIIVEMQKEKLDEIKNDYDYIVIDCPPSLGLITLNAFTAADSVLIPIQCEYYALEGLGQLMNTINLVKKHLNKSLEIEGALLTMYDVRTNLSNQVVKEVKKYFGDKVYKTVIPRNVKLSEAPSYGMPITIYDARSKGAKSYEKFVKELLKNNENVIKAKHMKE